MNNEDVFVTKKTLLKLACENKQKWEELAAYYYPFIKIILRHIRIHENDIEDISQNVMLKLWKNLSKFDPSRGKFRTWLISIIRNTAKATQIKQIKDKNRDYKYLEETSTTINDPLEEIFRNEWRKYITNVALENIRKQFSGKAVEVFLLSLKNLNAEQIAEKLDLKPDSVYRLKNRVKDQLVLEIKRLRTELEH
jgi:RNA polymerase sigma-70 factor (ECF subfamily)